MAAQPPRRFPANNGLALLHAKALLLTGRYQEAAGLLSSLDLLPSGGVTDGLALFHEADLMLAVERTQKPRHSIRRCARSRRHGNGRRSWGPANPTPKKLMNVSRTGLSTSVISGSKPRQQPDERSRRSSPSSPAGTRTSLGRSSGPWWLSSPGAPPRAKCGCKPCSSKTPATGWPGGPRPSSPGGQPRSQPGCKTSIAGFSLTFRSERISRCRTVSDLDRQRASTQVQARIIRMAQAQATKGPPTFPWCQGSG